MMSIVVIDPGHGGKDPGAQGNGLVEKQLTLQFGLKLRDWLRQHYQVDVRMTRETDTFLSLSDRAQFANRLNATYFISLHHNAAGGEGFESYVYLGMQENQSGTYQRIIHDEVMQYLSTLGVKDRGKKDANFAVLRETKMPALLLENLFVDHEHDANLLKNPAVIDEWTKSIAKGMAKALNLKELSPVQVPDWKKEAVDWMFNEGLLTNNEWKKTLENPLPLWAEAIILRRLYEKLNRK